MLNLERFFAHVRWILDFVVYLNDSTVEMFRPEKGWLQEPFANSSTHCLFVSFCCIFSLVHDYLMKF